MILPTLSLLVAAAPTTPILAVDTCVVGTWVNGKWRAVDHRFASGASPVTLRSFGIGTVSGPRARVKLVGEEVANGCYLADADNLRGSVHLSTLTPRIPRRVTSLPTTNATYQKVVRDFLDRKEVRNAKVRLSKIVRTDLDGDGTDEILLEASSRNDLDRVFSMDTGKRDYSLVLLRYVERGVVKSEPLEFVGHRSGETMELKRLRAVADLDGDGRMEIVTAGKGYEWTNARLWSYQRGRVRMLLENGEGV